MWEFILSIIGFFIGIVATITGVGGGISEALILMTAWGFAFALIKQVVALAGPMMALLLIRIVAFLSMSTWIGVSRTKISFPAKTVFPSAAMI